MKNTTKIADMTSLRATCHRHALAGRRITFKRGGSERVLWSGKLDYRKVAAAIPGFLAALPDLSRGGEITVFHRTYSDRRQPTSMKVMSIYTK